MVRHHVFTFVLLGAAVLATAPASSRQPELIADLATEPVGRGSKSESWVRAGGTVYFQRFRASTLPGTSTLELWATGGSAESTRLLLELVPGSVSTDLVATELPDGRLLFVASDEAFGAELWITDGTPEGTRLFADLCPGPCSSEPAPSSFGLGGHAGLVRWGDEVIFAATTTGGLRLFATDGNAAPRVISELRILGFAVSGNDLLLVTQDALFSGPLRIWRSGGTPGSETLIEELEENSVLSFGSFRDAALLVTADDFSGPLRLYRVSSEGANLVGEEPGAAEYRDTGRGANLAYVLYLEDSRCRLLRTDGTAAGTFELEAVAAASVDNFCTGPLTVAGDRLFLAHETAAGREPWTSDGTPLGTGLLRDIHPSGGSDPSRFTPLAGVVYFLASDAEGPGLWRSDGTTVGTTRVRGFEQVDAGFPSHPLGVLDGVVLFAADAGGTGLEPWRSDGTSGGTALVANLTSDVGSSNPQRYLRRDSDLLFETRIGDELEWYRYDGSAPPQRFFATPQRNLTRTISLAGDRLLVADGNVPFFGPTTVFAVDPDSGGSQDLFVGKLFGWARRAGDRVLVQMLRFVTSSLRATDQLWSTDGTFAGTTLFPEPLLGQFGAGAFEDGDTLWFAHSDDATGNELWRTDGTLAGTRLALDIVPGPESSSPIVHGVSGGRLFMGATVAGEPALVVTDRTPHLLHVLPLEPSAGAGAGLRARFLFTQPEVPADQLSPVLLRITDGTAGGTRNLATFSSIDMFFSIDPFGVTPFTLSRGLAFFAASTPEHGLELWATDGTSEGTRMVADIVPGPASSSPTELRDVDGVLLFTASTPESGAEPWVTDGTEEGTRTLGEVYPGPAGSHPRSFTAVGDEVVFTAERPDVGREPFAIDRASLRSDCAPSEHTLCLGEDRFLVEVEWLDRPSGSRGRGHAVPFRADTGQFWFFDPDNIELLVKVLDGTSLNDHRWVFYGALSDVQYWVTVVDTWTGHTRSYTNEQGDLCGVNDTSALPAGERLPSGPRATQLPMLDAAIAPADAGANTSQACDPATQLCLQGGRFAVEVDWRTFQGSSGAGVPIPMTDDTGAFWFFGAENVEMAVKVLDARVINDRFWVYFGALSDVAYTVRVTDTETGAVRVYENAEGTICGQADVNAFVP
jgi:ELWxxDGT repeat protein